MSSDRARWNEKHRSGQVVGGAPSDWLLEHTALLDAEPKGRALDLACGRGRHVLLLAELGFAVDALEVLGRRRGADRPERFGARRHRRRRRVDLTEAPFPNQPYDVIVDTYYLERPLFARMTGALAPGGLHVFETLTKGLRRPRQSARAPPADLAGLPSSRFVVTTRPGRARERGGR